MICCVSLWVFNTEWKVANILHRHKPLLTNANTLFLWSVSCFRKKTQKVVKVSWTTFVIHLKCLDRTLAIWHMAWKIILYIFYQTKLNVCDIFHCRLFLNPKDSKDLRKKVPFHAISYSYHKNNTQINRKHTHTKLCNHFKQETPLKTRVMFQVLKKVWPGKQMVMFTNYLMFSWKCYNTIQEALQGNMLNGGCFNDFQITHDHINNIIHYWQS